MEGVLDRSHSPQPPTVEGVLDRHPPEGRRAQSMKHRCPERAGRVVRGASEGREVRMSKDGGRSDMTEGCNHSPTAGGSLGGKRGAPRWRGAICSPKDDANTIWEPIHKKADESPKSAPLLNYFKFLFATTPI